MDSVNEVEGPAAAGTLGAMRVHDVREVEASMA